MPNPLSALIEKKLGPLFLPALKREVIGLAQDFWHDGAENPFARKSASGKKPSKPHAPESTAFSRMMDKDMGSGPAWHAEPGAIAEIMWGQGFIHPGGNSMFERMLAPLQVQDGTKLLNLSAGLGGGQGALAGDGAAVTNYESAPDLAARCSGLHITPFTPGNLHLAGSFDAALTRELFHRLPDRAAFLAQLAAILTPGAPLLFTDYIVNPEDRAQKAVADWQAGHDNAQPPGLVELAEDLARAGFSVKESEDLTARHKQDLMDGLKKLARHLAAAGKPDSATRLRLASELQNMTLTAAALDHGLKFYRFNAVKQ